MDSMEPVSEVQEEEVGLFSTGLVYTGCILAMITNKTAEWITVVSVPPLYTPHPVYIRFTTDLIH